MKYPNRICADDLPHSHSPRLLHRRKDEQVTHGTLGPQWIDDEIGKANAMSEAPELKPCPFCAGTNTQIEVEEICCPIEFLAHARCSDCDTIGPLSEFKYDNADEAEADAVNMWNTRPLYDAQAKMAEALAYERAASLAMERHEAYAKRTAEAERGGPSHKGYVTDSTFHHWGGKASAYSEICHDIRALATSPNALAEHDAKVRAEERERAARIVGKALYHPVGSKTEVDRNFDHNLDVSNVIHAIREQAND